MKVEGTLPEQKCQIFLSIDINIVNMSQWNITVEKNVG